MKFYMVIGRNSSTTSKRHETKEDAVKEATRLAQSEGKEFYLLEATHVIRTVLTPVEMLRIDEHGVVVSEGMLQKED